MKTNRSTDELVEIGAKIKSLSEIRDRYAAVAAKAKLAKATTQAEHHANSAESTYFSSAEEACDFEIYQLRDRIPYAKATSMEGAALQVMELIYRTDWMFDKVPEAGRDFDFKQSLHCVKRMLYSVLDLLIEKSDKPTVDSFSESVGNSHLNPWLTPEMALAIVAEKNSTSCSSQE